MLTPEQIQQYRQRYQITPVDAPTPMKQQGGGYRQYTDKIGEYSENAIKEQFQGGISQAKEGYNQAREAGQNITSDPFAIPKMIWGGTKLAVGAGTALLSPLGGSVKPIMQGTEYAGEKLADASEKIQPGTLQNFAQSKVGQKTSDVVEGVATVNNLVGTVAGIKVGGPRIGNVVKNTTGAVSDIASSTTKSVKPTIAGAGRILKEAGESAYGVTVTTSEGTSRALASYKESTPNLMTRIRNTVTGETKGKPIAEAETAARYGLMGTEKEIGVQAGRYMTKVWTETVQPALRRAKGKLEMNKFWSVLEKKIRTENPELTRRNALLEGLNDLKSGYGKVSRVGLEKLQEYKEGWTKFQSEQVWKGKPIASATKEVMKMSGDMARDFIYKNTPEEVRQAYIDYGNLKSIKEAGIKSGVGDPAKKSISRGAWQFVMDKAITPVATTMGKILYRTGEGLEFIGEPGAKTIGDIVGKQASQAQTVNISKLVSHEGAPETKTVAQYKSDIQAGKPIEPIKVIQEGDKYGIEDGKHRYQAYVELGIKDIPVEIIKKSLKTP